MLLTSLKTFSDDLLHTIIIILLPGRFLVASTEIASSFKHKMNLLEGYRVVSKIERKPIKISITGTKVGE